MSMQTELETITIEIGKGIKEYNSYIINKIYIIMVIILFIMLAYIYRLEQSISKIESLLAKNKKAIDVDLNKARYLGITKVKGNKVHIHYVFVEKNQPVQYYTVEYRHSALRSK